MSEQLAAAENLFFDPFAEEGEEFFDPLAAHQAMWERYAAGEVEHDYTADEFVADTEALLLDAQFTGRFVEAQAIAANMHLLCGEDHGLAQSVQNNESLSGQLSGLLGHEGHDHTKSGKDEEEYEEHNEKTCADCRAGRHCTKRSAH